MPSQPDDERTGEVFLMGEFRENEVLDELGVGSQVVFSRFQKEVSNLAEDKLLYMDTSDVLLYTKMK